MMFFRRRIVPVAVVVLDGPVVAGRFRFGGLRRLETVMPRLGFARLHRRCGIGLCLIGRRFRIRICGGLVANRVDRFRLRRRGVGGEQGPIRSLDGVYLQHAGIHFGQHRLKAAFLPIGAAQPNKADEGDPRLSYVYLSTIDYSYEAWPGTEIAFSLWHLRDNTEGKAFAFEGLVPSGPASTGLFPYTGVADFDLESPTGSVTWVGVNFNHNADFRTGDLAVTGYAIANFGRFESQKAGTTLNKDLAIAGFAADLELAYNHGKGLGDVITLEGLFTSGDDDVKDAEYDGVFTLNHYGLPGAVWFDHKTLLLFPFTSTVSNYTGAVTDISNQGYGLQAAILTGAQDLIPEVLNLKLGVAAARSSATPPPGVFNLQRGRTIGAEFNAELKWNVRYLMTIGLHAGYLAVGDFFDAVPTVDANPWAAFSTFTWYGF